MKAFKLLEFDNRPLKLKGNRIFPGTAIPLTSDSLSKGIFIALPSGASVELVTGGMLAKSLPEVKAAYALMKPMGVSLGEGLADVPNQLEQVYVEESLAGSIYSATVNASIKNDELLNFWIPGDFNFPNGESFEGWFMLKNSSIDLLIINYSGNKFSSFEIIAKNNKRINFEI
ncbi:hypothetical protein [Zooshikella sp. RANM57]|uniref:hypothetical protein n=1 Tax=Zooshikella sp. RANM57 TaxID=3425863 RepID=UPI003D6FB808